MYDALIFDFFGVICSEVSTTWLRKHAPDTKASLLKDMYVSAADRDEISQDELFADLGKLTDESPERIERDWKALAKVDHRVVSLIRELKARYKIGLLTNSPSRLLYDLVQREKLADLFDASIVSGEVGLAKPDWEIFKKMLDALGVPPAKALMIDDSAANIEAAKQVGMGAFLYTGYEDLATHLRGLQS